jgi:hypothetical protein
MSARGETSSSHHRGETLKPSTRGSDHKESAEDGKPSHREQNTPEEAACKPPHATHHEKSVLNINLRHRPVANRGDSKKSAHSGHMSHRSKSLIIVMALLLLKTTSHETRFIALKRSIRASLNFVDSLARDGMNTGRGRDKIPGASALKRINILSHGKLPFGVTLSILIRSRLEGNRKIVLTRRVTIRWTTMTSRKRRGNLIRRRRHIGRRRDIRRSIQNSRTPRIMKGKRRQRRGGWTVRRGRRRTRW